MDRKRATDRKLRLLIASICRDVLTDISSAESVALVDALERFADGRLPAEALGRAAAAFRPPTPPAPGDNVLAVAGSSVAWPADSPSLFCLSLLTDPHCITGYHRDKQRRPAFVRDIFGNPFRPVAFDASWRTPTAAALAGQMYGSRDFGATPILADALQDAGCDTEEVLAHCRDPHATHVRGCWVVDLVLGKL